MLENWIYWLVCSIVGTVLVARTMFNYLEGVYPKGSGWKAFIDTLVYGSGTIYFMFNLLILIGF